MKFYKKNLLALSLIALMIIGPLHSDDKEKKVVEIPAVEDLMREHGLLNRILIIYEEIIRRLQGNFEFEIQTLTSAVSLVRSFIQDYHEKLEEEYIFPIVSKRRKYTKLVNELIRQHNIGRRLTDEIKQLSLTDLKKQKNKMALIRTLKKFITMYRAHETREDTVIFTAFHSLISPDEYKKLSDIFEDTEHEKFGKKGFKGILLKIVKLEKKLNVYNLKKFS